MSQRMARLALIAVAALGFAPAAWGHGWALRYASTVVGVPTVVHAIGVGIVSLLIPVVGLFLAIVLLVLRRARSESASV